MAFKFVSFFAFLAAASAGVVPVAYSGHDAHYTAPVAHYAAAPVVAKIAAPVAYAAPAYHQEAHFTQTATKVSAPVAYAAAPAYYHEPHYAAQSYHHEPHYAAPIAKVVTKVAEEYDPNPQYSFSYDVQDSLTGDSKSQSEKRNGDFVSGHYSLIDADGTKRTVEYTADPHNGFNAVVHKEPLHQKVIATAPVVKVAAAPVAYKTVAAPVAYADPHHYHH